MNQHIPCLLNVPVSPDLAQMLTDIGNMTEEHFSAAHTAGKLLEKITPILHDEYQQVKKARGELSND